MPNTMNLKATSPLAKWLSYLENSHFKAIDLGLERVKSVAEELDLLNPAPYVITVGGTNGKGTTCRLLETILLNYGLRVGVYSSPHLLSYNERVRIQNQDLPDEMHTVSFDFIEKHKTQSLTYFEFSTLSALHLFKQAKLDVVILEVGLGGRLDATNIVDNDLAVITSIDIDHTDFLGSTREEIGFEKDFLRWMLSDGAGAVQLSNHPNQHGLSLKIQWIDLISYANEMPVCMYAGAEIRNEQFVSWKNVTKEEREARSLMAVKQDVKLLNENIVRCTVENALSRLIDKYDLKADEIDYFLPHYSSGFFRDKLLDGLKNINFEIPQEKWFTNLESKGNTGSASIYIILQEFLEKFPLQNGQKVLCYIPESGRFSSCFMLLEVVNGH